MIPIYRKKFNQEFSAEKHREFLNKIQLKPHSEMKFRVSESPIFMPYSFRQKLEEVGKSILQQIQAIPNEELLKAVPVEHCVPNDSGNPHFLIFDFGICKDEKGGISPQLIELQAFPSLYGFMKIQQESYSETYPFLKELNPELSHRNYVSKLKNVILGNEKPENVILLEIFPTKQKTNIDFKITEQMLGIQTVCVTEVKKKGKNLYYEKEEVQIPIHRIYNRVIFDELDKVENLKLEFDFNEDLNVKWISHPNWFFKISKFILPKLTHDYIPKSYYLKDFPSTENLDTYVLKPLYSFAGSGVNLNPTQKDIDQIQNTSNYILQRKVKYESVFEDINGDFAKAEIRMMYVWEDEKEYPEWIINLVRMTKSEWANMSSMDDQTIWTGCSFAFFEKK
ncbi:MAG: hypothetical protein WCY77_02525 [Weeksellaceae bacterium]